MPVGRPYRFRSGGENSAALLRGTAWRGHNVRMDLPSLVAAGAAQSPPAWFGVVFAIGVAALVIAQYIRFRRRK